MKRFLIAGLFVMWGITTIGQIRSANDVGFKMRHLTESYAHPWLSKTSVNIGLGFSAYGGDLANTTHFSRQRYHLNPHLNLGLQRRMSTYLSWHLSLNYFHLYAESAPGTQEITRFSGRNQDAYFAIQIDFNPRPYLESRYRKFNAYALAGAGVGRFDVRDGDGNKVAGQEPIISPVFPVGIGVQFFINDFIDVGFEAVKRFTLTDEIDGVTVMNTKPKNDSYLLYGFKMNYKMFRKFKYKGYLKRLGH